MSYCFRLANLVNYDPDPNKRPGTIKRIVEGTGLDRHLVSAILRNEAKSISLEAMSKLCDYLIRKQIVPADELPGALFGLEAETFWETVAGRKRVEICIGVRREGDSKLSDNAWIVAADSLLLGAMLQGISTIAGSPRESEEDADNDNQFDTIPSHLDYLQQRLVWSPDEDDQQTVRKLAHEVYDEFHDTASDAALVSIGSIKSNPVSELINSNIFRTKPFVGRSDFADARERSCPLFLRYRDNDPKFESCCAGVKLAKNIKSKHAGIYFETESGDWECCPWEYQKYDVAAVTYEVRDAQSRVEMSIGGFSGQSTRWLAELLNDRAREFWPPAEINDSLKVGAFLVAFEVDPDMEDKHLFLGGSRYKSASIIRLADSVIQRRLMD